MAPKQPPKPEFQEGERVLCFHGPLLYEAKCLQVATEDKQVRYLVHYSGWNKNWDEWVPESRVLRYSEANLQRQRDLHRANQEQRARGAAQGRKGSAASSLQQQQQNVETLFQNICITPSTSSASASASASATATATATAAVTPKTPGRQTRKGRQKPVPAEGGTDGARGGPQQFHRRRTRGHPSAKGPGASATGGEAKIQIPMELKRLLVQDQDLVTKQKKLFSLPAKKNVDSILEDYVTYKKARGEGDNTEYAAEDTAGGIRAHFNVLLGTQLLYEVERPQYAQILATHPTVPMSQLYGAPHLLRLFVPLGAVLAHSPFDEKSLASLFNYLHDFLKYLEKNSSAFFNASEYQDALPE